MTAASFSICLARKLPTWQGVAHCTAEQAHTILECVEEALVERREFSCDVLVPNRFEFAEAFPEIPCDHASIEDYLHFTLKGIAQ